MNSILLIRHYFIAFLSLLFNSICLFGNDGSYTGSGNQLVPVKETDIALEKEILTIRRIDGTAIVSVYYELFNPGDEKEIIVGFEANSSSFPSMIHPKNGGHPYIDNFNVNVNGKQLKHTIAYLLNDESLPANKRSITLPKLTKYIDKDPESASFTYVYSFKVKFKKGHNIIKHDYEYQMSSSIGMIFGFDYKLTPANRWANGQIDDFTLILDLGEYVGINLPMYGSVGKENWTFTGSGHDGRPNAPENNNQRENVFIESGQLIFHAKDYHPEEELTFDCPDYEFDYESEQRAFTSIPYSFIAQERMYPEDLSPFDKKVFDNLQLARDGYVFPDKSLYDYFMKNTIWYIPDPNYKPQ